MVVTAVELMGRRAPLAGVERVTGVVRTQMSTMISEELLLVRTPLEAAMLNQYLPFARPVRGRDTTVGPTVAARMGEFGFVVCVADVL